MTNELIDKRAWAEQIRRTDLSRRLNLIGWLQTVKKMGRGTGRRVPRLMTEARRLMSESRSSVPVWIMPLARVVENFDPKNTQFDVVIIDEASQSDVMALVALYMGREVVVVGDPEQVTPDDVGAKIEEVDRLIDQHLEGIPNRHLYDGQTSIYHLAQQSFGGHLCLTEHFRCVPDIIEFSNGLSYNWQLQPLRDASNVPVTPHVIAHRVDGVCGGNNVNTEETLTVAALIKAAIEQPEYERNDEGQPTSFGVVSLLGEAQAIEIDRLLRQHLAPRLYERHRILCGNAAQFQGDERDVMFLSVVDSPREGTLPIQQRDAFKKRYNVAASRARNQMWVVHSVDPSTDLRSDDLRRRLIEHARDPFAAARRREQAEQETESEFERQVLRRLMAAGYKVTTQWSAGHYRIDLVVEGEERRRLAVECDGDRYHPIEKLPADLERQAVLERAGWRFHRIRGSHFFRDPDGAMEGLFGRLRAEEIDPVGHTTDRPAPPASTDLQERVIRRSAELRRDWESSQGTEPDDDESSPFGANTERPTPAGSSAVPAPRVIGSNGKPPPPEYLVQHQTGCSGKYDTVMHENSDLCASAHGRRAWRH
ncbi:MAG TPA: AAA domain-containing protein [Chloroflexota bacterium]